jgi:hypothetical protein
LSFFVSFVFAYDRKQVKTAHFFPAVIRGARGKIEKTPYGNGLKTPPMGFYCAPGAFFEGVREAGKTAPEGVLRLR